MARQIQAQPDKKTISDLIGKIQRNEFTQTQKSFGSISQRNQSSNTRNYELLPSFLE